jgi:cysteine desulfurase
MDFIYLDNNATTPLLPEAWDAMRPYFLDHPGNPASSHGAGRKARQALENAREQIAHLLEAQADQVIFTSGATEANNLAIFGLAGAIPGHLVSSPLEHPCVAGPLQQLVSHGFVHTELPVSGAGVVSVPEDFIRPDTRLVAVMLANHEVGALQPIENLVSRVAGRAPFHCDAAAAAGKIPFSFRRLGVTSLTISAHKFHGPKGIGTLVVKNPTKLRPLFWGGHQQHGTRPGTEPVPLAVGMAAALAWAVRSMETNRRAILQMRELFLARLRKEAAPVVVNGPEEGGVPHTLNLSFPGCQADILVMSLDLAGVACSTGSACSSGSLLPSPVLRAMGVAGEILHSALRFSLSPCLSMAQVEEAARRIILTVNRLRQNLAVG